MAPSGDQQQLVFTCGFLGTRHWAVFFPFTHVNVTVTQ